MQGEKDELDCDLHTKNATIYSLVKENSRLEIEIRCILKQQQEEREAEGRRHREECQGLRKRVKELCKSNTAANARLEKLELEVRKLTRQRQQQANQTF